MLNELTVEWNGAEMTMDDINQLEGLERWDAYQTFCLANIGQFVEVYAA